MSELQIFTDVEMINFMNYEFNPFKQELPTIPNIIPIIHSPSNNSNSNPKFNEVEDNSISISKEKEHSMKKKKKKRKMTPKQKIFNKLERKYEKYIKIKSIKELNKTIKNDGLTQHDRNEIRKGRRRIKNRFYAQRSRSKNKFNKVTKKICKIK